MRYSPRVIHDVGVQRKQMRRVKKYAGLCVDATCMRHIAAAFDSVFRDLSPSFETSAPMVERGGFGVERGTETWFFETFEEFSLELDKPYNHAQCSIRTFGTTPHVALTLQSYMSGGQDTSIDTYSSSREILVRLASLLDQAMRDYGVASSASPEPVVFIGHGRSGIWRDLKEHLVDHHGYHVETFESGVRSGYVASQVLDKMLAVASIAFLVMTAEDEMADGVHRARQNVIHEVGLFQGRLGFTRAIVLKEEGVEDFSNIDGIQQIRFSAGNIRETFGEVVATVKREVGRQPEN